MHTNIFTKFDKDLMKLFDLESGHPVDVARPPALDRPPARRMCSKNTSRFLNNTNCKIYIS